MLSRFDPERRTHAGELLLDLEQHGFQEIDGGLGRSLAEGRLQVVKARLWHGFRPERYVDVEFPVRPTLEDQSTFG